MKENTKSELQNIIIKILVSQPNLKKGSNSLKYYMNELERDLVSVPDEAIRESISIFNEQELYKDKPFSYLKAVIYNKHKDILSTKDKDKRRLGYLPKNIL